MTCSRADRERRAPTPTPFREQAGSPAARHSRPALPSSSPLPCRRTLSRPAGNVRSCRVCGFPSLVLAGAAPQGVPVSGDLLALSAFQPCVVLVFCTKANSKSRQNEYKSQKRTRRNFEKGEGASPDLTQKRKGPRPAVPLEARRAARAQGGSRVYTFPSLACSAHLILKKLGRKKAPRRNAGLISFY